MPDSRQPPASPSNDDLFRFECPHCGQRIKVPSQRVGQRAKCPRCVRILTIPKPRGATSDAPANRGELPRLGTVLEGKIAPESVAESEPPSVVVPTVADTAVPQGPDLPGSPANSEIPVNPARLAPPPLADAQDDEYVELLYSSEPDLVRPVVDERLVAVPRAVIILQGILLLVVGGFAFILGSMFGKSAVAPRDASQLAVPCLIAGRIEYRDRLNRLAPDSGAVILIVPQDQRPDLNAKAPIEGLRPGDPEPLESHPGLRSLRQIGGEYVRAGAEGEYRIRVMSGKYFVLILSRHVSRDTREPLDKQQLAAIGRYVESAVDLLGEQRFEWREVVVARDRTVSTQF